MQVYKLSGNVVAKHSRRIIRNDMDNIITDINNKILNDPNTWDVVIDKMLGPDLADMNFVLKMQELDTTGAISKKHTVSEMFRMTREQMKEVRRKIESELFERDYSLREGSYYREGGTQ